jgi:DNA-binding transcriptional ArsR family regulator
MAGRVPARDRCTLEPMKPPTDIDDPRFVKALSHPLRVRILALLQERTATPAQLARRLHTSVGTAAYHVRTLHELGLIELVEETRVRGGIAHHYRARATPRLSGPAWAGASPVAKQAAVGAALDTIAEYARAAAAIGGFDGPGAHLTRTALRLDAEAWEEASAACHELLERLARIGIAAGKRLAAEPHARAPLDVSVALLMFEAVRLSDSR